MSFPVISNISNETSIYHIAKFISGFLSFPKKCIGDCTLAFILFIERDCNAPTELLFRYTLHSDSFFIITEYALHFLIFYSFAIYKAFQNTGRDS